MLIRGNLLEGEAPVAGERFEDLATVANARVERIVSSETPDQSVYDQAHDEWVVLIEGEATLDVTGERIDLRAGDWLFLPARTPHRVVATSAGAIWLAVHGR